MGLDSVPAHKLLRVCCSVEIIVLRKLGCRDIQVAGGLRSEEDT